MFAFVAKRKYWVAWFTATLVLGVYLTFNLVAEDRTTFLPGSTSDGHYQIELACEACHTDTFTSRDEMQDACVGCHADELKRVSDSHPKSKFTDPRNSVRVAKLDARYCVTCHAEHREEITASMGVTVAGDVCLHCHADIEDDRPSHKDMAFTTCADAGCHNFHDNTALYEDFLVKHANKPDVQERALVPERNFSRIFETLTGYPVDTYPKQRLKLSDRDHPESLSIDPMIYEDWAATSHAKAGVNCSGCHVTKSSVGKQEWTDKPGTAVCATCHKSEEKGFLASKHGMRLAQGLSPMTTAAARKEMRVKPHAEALGCSSCHSAHRFDTRYAAVDACLGCHVDEHSEAYKGSPHFELWRKQTVSTESKSTGVSCATCHLPREPAKQDGIERVIVRHNQNDFLRPAEKMIRPVCMNCHGLGFSIDALADPQLVKNNFKGPPLKHIESIDMALKREVAKKP